ncbi:ArsR family transcriptional regulator [Methanosarcinales archaeon]|nr:MAG: ArsR family transcriptional regulator [Methanosarcinales archaeon]
MCNCHPRMLKSKTCISALHCPTRWTIIDFIGGGSKSTREIYEFLTLHNARLTSSGLYYHLSELSRAGIIEVSEYREKGGGAPEKVWKLKTTQIVIDLLENEAQDNENRD